MNFKNVLKILSLIFLAGAIAFSPSFSAGTLSDGRIIEIRAEDILILILGFLLIISFFASGQTKIERPPLFFPILIWLTFGLLSTLTNWAFANLSIERGFFYFLKEFQFFVFYFYVFWGIKKIDTAKLLVNVWLIFAFINVLYVLYQMVTGSPRGEYGTAAIGEWGVFPTGAFFLLLFIFLFNVFLYYFLRPDTSVSDELRSSSPTEPRRGEGKDERSSSSFAIARVVDEFHSSSPFAIARVFKKIGLAILTFSPVFGVFGSASRTDFVAMLLALFLTFLFFSLRKINFKIISVFVLSIVFLALIFYFSLGKVPMVASLKAVISVSSLEPLWQQYKASRLYDVIEPMFKKSLDGSLAHLPFLGMGKGYVGEAHNQYLRNFIEMGAMGNLIFFILIVAVIRKSWQGFSKNSDRLVVGLSAGLLVATLTLLFISFATEPFIVVKPSSVYWFFAGITMAVLSLNKK